MSKTEATAYVLADAERRPDADRSFSPRETIWLVVAAMAVVLGTARLFWGLTLDDAYITFRYARHLAEGYGFGAWNHTGERVEGYSSPLWMVLLSGAARLGIDLRLASKVLGLVAAAAVLVALFRRRDHRPSVLAGVFLAVYLPFLLYTASGMEAVAFTSLVTLVLVGPAAWQPIVAPLLIAMRPEGPLIAGIDVLAMAWRRERRSLVVATAATTGLMYATIMAQRWTLYGSLAPNTYYAKVAGGGLGHLQLGLIYVGTWLLAHAVVVVFITIGAVAAVRARDPRGLTCLVLLSAYTLYVAVAGGDAPTAFPAWRQYVQIAPAWVLLAMSGLTSVVRGRRWKQVGAAVGLAIVANAGGLLLQGAGGPSRNINAYFSWIGSLATPTTTISSSYGGKFPYDVDAVHIDAFGLNTTYIARNGTYDPDGPQDSKTDMGWVLEQRPDIIEGYLSGTALLRGAGRDELLGPRRHKMILEMVTSPAFQREYDFVRNAPYADGLDRAVFLRHDFCAAHPSHDALDCVPVAQTSLAAFAR